MKRQIDEFQTRDWVDVYAGRQNLLKLENGQEVFQTRDWVDVYAGEVTSLPAEWTSKVSNPRLG